MYNNNLIAIYHFIALPKKLTCKNILQHKQVKQH